MSGTKVTLVAIAPDGTKITYRTSGGYDYAGLIKYAAPRGGWALASKGWSRESVLSNARARMNRTIGAVEYTVVPFREELPKAIEEYAKTRNLRVGGIVMVFKPGAGWQNTLRQPYPSRSVVRKLAREGVVSIAVNIEGRATDFQISELT